MEFAEQAQLERCHGLSPDEHAPNSARLNELTPFNAQLTATAMIWNAVFTGAETAFEHASDSLWVLTNEDEGGYAMKRWILTIAATVVAYAGSTAVLAFDQAKYAALKMGAKDCEWCDLTGAELSNSNLSEANLSGADLTGADLSGADLRKVDFAGADLTGVNVDGADLSGANLAGAELDQVDLTKTVLTDARLETAYCDWATKFPAGSLLACVGVTVERK